MCSTGACVIVSARCSSGTCVTVGAAGGIIHVHDSKSPDATPIAWTPEMWTSSVLARVIEGQLPPGAVTQGLTRQDVEAGSGVVAWDGGSVLWRGRDEHDTPTELEFDADEWTAFVHAVDAGEYDVPRLVG